MSKTKKKCRAVTSSLQESVDEEHASDHDHGAPLLEERLLLVHRDLPTHEHLNLQASFVRTKVRAVKTDSWSSIFGKHRDLEAINARHCNSDMN